MENQKQSTKFEKFLFAVTRIFAILGSILALTTIVLLATNLSKTTDNDHVSFADINTKSTAQNGSVSDASSSMESQSLIIHDKIKEYFSGDNEKIFNDWVDSLETNEQKQDFIDNLSEVISEAESKKVDVVNTINNYKTLKFARINKNQFEKYKELGERAAIFAVILFSAIFLTLMSLVLVMLAIERNTRKS